MKTTYTFPGFVDVHVHFRDPGLPAAETTASGLAAAVRGGMRTVVTMPNTVPACDSPDLMRYQRAAAAASGVTGCTLLTSACITKGRLGKEVADLEALAEAGAAFFTDDGSYVADDKVMEEAMRRAYDLNIVVCQHAMDPQELKGGVIRDCELARKLNLPIISVETETRAIRRDLSLCRETGCRLHIQHISTAAGVEKLSELKWLRLNENKLTSLPDLSALKNLRRIYLRDNRLTAVPETLKDLSALTDIELSGNPIKTVPNWLAEKRGLENVSLNRTQITALPEDLSAWKGLKSLQLGELDLPAAEMARIRAALPDVAIVF